jgi:hypothetical protein
VPRSIKRASIHQLPHTPLRCSVKLLKHSGNFNFLFFFCLLRISRKEYTQILGFQRRRNSTNLTSEYRHKGSHTSTQKRPDNAVTDYSGVPRDGPYLVRAARVRIHTRFSAHIYHIAHDVTLCYADTELFGSASSATTMQFAGWVFGTEIP